MHIEQLKSGRWAICYPDGDVAETFASYAAARRGLKDWRQ